MKIIAYTWALNSILYIENFCAGYSFADEILIIDGGSTDGTVEIARNMPKVTVIDASEHRIELPDAPGGFCNPEPVQINIGIGEARRRGADWIIKDDADCWPNPRLRARARDIFTEADRLGRPLVYAYRLYIWHENRYFPKVNEAGQSLWGWRPNMIHIYGDESSWLNTGVRGLNERQARADGQILDLDMPEVLLHYYCLNDEVVAAKQRQKAAKGIGWTHPLESIYAPAVPLPAWATEDV